MRRTTILAYGAYGIQNSGDDAPLIAMMAWLRKNYPYVNFDLGVISRHRDEDLCLWSGGRHIQNLEYETREESIGKTFYGLSPGEDRGVLSDLWREFEKADLLLLGAGNFLNDLCLDVGRGPMSHAIAMIFMAQLSDTPVFLYGPGAGPFRTRMGAKVANWIVDNSSDVVFRRCQGRNDDEDEEDDPVFLLPRPSSSFRSGLVCILRNTDCFSSGSLNATVEISKPYNPRYIRTSTYIHDPDYGPALREHPLNLLDSLSTAKGCFTSRLHGAVYAVMAGITPVAISYMPKVAQFMSSLGLERFCVGLNDLHRKDYVRSLINEAMESDPPDCPGPPVEYVVRVSRLLGLPGKEHYVSPDAFPGHPRVGEKWVD